MVEGTLCVSQMNQELAGVKKGSNPKEVLLNNYSELLKERVVTDANGKEIGTRLKDLIKSAKTDAQENQKKGEPFSRAIIRNALRKLNYNFCQNTLAGLPTGPAYERTFPDNIAPENFGHEKVGYPMSDYSQLSSLPVGGLGAPLCEVDYETCYLKAGQMIQDAAFRKMTVTIGSNEYNLAEAQGTYHALYPFSETTYNLAIPLSVLQYSPVIPGNYRASSLPVEVIELVATNPTDAPVKVSFTINQENILGWHPQKGPDTAHAELIWKKQGEGNYIDSFASDNIVGLVFKKEGKQKDFVRVGTGIAGQIAIASPTIEGKVEVVSSLPAKGKDKPGSLTITFTLQPGEKIEHPIVVTYDTPFYNFQYDATKADSPGARMPKFYTRHYGADGQNAGQIAVDALNEYKGWKHQIKQFQNIILQDPDLPDFFKQALLNELYILAETGIWEADEGRFAYLESIDYKMYNTSDVNSYTWALLTLYPELERKDLLEFSKLVPLSDPTRRWFGTDRWANIPPAEWKHLYWAAIKDEGAVCHDLGGLLGEGVFPFTNTCNEFNWSNANMWIDLAPKFALRTWRYVTFMLQQTGSYDYDFVADVYPSVKMALDSLEERWGNPDTHVPISKGIPDWTYDTIAGEGYTPNVVTQWLGALEAAAAMATLIEDYDAAKKYWQWHSAGKPVLDSLWNENGYYNAFSTPDGSKINNHIHSDMLFGDFYARMCGLKPVAPEEKSTKSLQTIYAINGQKWSEVGNHGPLGLVNLRGPNGEQNKTEQGDEGWTGTMLLNAAYQIKLGKDTNNPELIQNGWAIVHGFYNVTYSNSPDGQHWFGRTPEGYVNPDDLRYNDSNKKYGIETGRAPKYMRPLAIWAVYAAIKGNQMPFNIYYSKIPEQKDVFPLPFGKEE